jgi:tight adherence protein C
MPLEFLLTIVAVFGCVALITGAMASYALAHQAPGRRRLRAVVEPKRAVAVDGKSSLLPSTNQLARRFAMFLPKSPKNMSRLQQRMARAGYHGLGPAAVYRLLELTVPLLCGGLAFLLVPGPSKLLVTAFVVFVAYMVPGLVLLRLISRRQKVIQNGLADALDLFIVCLEAGSSLDQAIVKASDELDVAYPALAEELQMLTVETRAGKPRLEAFKNFATRTGVDDVRALVAMLVQTDRFGTSVADALRTHAKTSRTKRRQRAEERAAKISVKIVFPLVFCLFPAFYVVTLGPGIVKFVRVFFQGFLNQ